MIIKYICCHDLDCVAIMYCDCPEAPLKITGKFGPVWCGRAYAISF